MGNMQDYGLAVFNGQGANVLASELFTPKLIGTMVLKRDGGTGLWVRNEAGEWLANDDGRYNIPLRELRGRGQPEPRYTWGKPIQERMHERFPEQFSWRYQFALYGSANPDEAGAPLLPAVIHGWGSKPRDDAKLQMAQMLVSSVVSGQDLQSARILHALQKGRTLPKNWDGRSGDPVRMPSSGLPCAVTFRSTSLNPADPAAGFGLVTYLGGLLEVEMTANTQIELHFYDMAGIPQDYFAKCSNVMQPESYGLAVFDYEPAMTQYAMPVHAADNSFSQRLEFGQMERARYFFANTGNGRLTRSSMVQALERGEHAAGRRKLAEFLEGSADAPLRYERYNTASRRLRLLSNADTVKKGTQLERQIVRVRNRDCALYTLQAGHDYAKVCTPAQHAAGGLFSRPGGGAAEQAAGAGRFSRFENQIGNVPLSRQPESTVSDTYQSLWANPAKLKIQMVPTTGANGKTVWLPEAGANNPKLDAIYRDPAKLKELNDAFQQQKWGLQLAYSSATGVPLNYEIPNPDYDAERAAQDMAKLRAERLEMLKLDAESWLERSEAGMKELDSRFQAWKGLRDFLDAVADTTESDMSFALPFFGMPAYRHSDGKLEMFQYLSLLQPETKLPDYLPANWLLCSMPA